MLLKEIKITDKYSKKLFIEKCISLVAKLDFSNIYKRRLYENIPLFFYASWMVGTTVQEWMLPQGISAM